MRLEQRCGAITDSSWCTDWTICGAAGVSEALRRGWAARWRSPLLRIDNGKLVLAQRVRTASKALAAMVDRVCEVVGDNAAAVAVHHVANEEGAVQLAATLAERLPACRPAIVTDLGPVLALHVGAGALAVCVEVSP